MITFLCSGRVLVVVEVVEIGADVAGSLGSADVDVLIPVVVVASVIDVVLSEQ